MTVCLRTETQICPDGTVTTSSDATLSALAVNDGTSDLTLTPGFASEEYTYTATVGNAVTQVTVTATKNDANASVAYSVPDADTSTPGRQVTLNVGENPIVVTVTAADGSTQTYTVTVTRAAAGFVCADPEPRRPHPGVVRGPGRGIQYQ